MSVVNDRGTRLAYRERLSEPSVLKTRSSMLALAAVAFLTIVLVYVAPILIRSGDVRTLTNVMPLIIGLALAHTVVRSRGAAIMAALLTIVLMAVRFVIFSVMTGLPLSLYLTSFALMSVLLLVIGGLYELMHLGGKQASRWKGWRTYVGIVGISILIAVIFEWNTMYGTFVLMIFLPVAIVIALVLVFVLRNIYALVMPARVEAVSNE